MPENPYQPPKEVGTPDPASGPAVQQGQPAWIIPAVLIIFAVTMIADLWIMFGQP